MMAPLDTDRLRLEAFRATTMAALEDLVIEALRVRDEQRFAVDGLREDLRREIAEHAETTHAYRVAVDVLAAALLGPEMSPEYDLDLPHPAWPRKAARAIVRLQARVAELEANPPLPPGVALDDLSALLLAEANEDSGAVRACLDFNDEISLDLNVPDSIVELCGKVRDLTVLVAEMQEDAARRAAEPRPAATARAKVKPPTDTRNHVAMRNDANGRRFWDGASWITDHVSAFDSARLDVETLSKLKPRGSKLVALDDVPALLAADALKAAMKQAPALAADLPVFSRRQFLEGLEQAGNLMTKEADDLAALRAADAVTP